LFTSLAHARAALAAWRLDYNTVRPHGSIGNLAPADYATRSVPASQRDGTLRSIAGFAPRLVAASSLQGSNGQSTLPTDG
jgi:putative transposase